MKALFCAYCCAIVGLPRDGSVAGCRCDGGMNRHGPRCRGRWADPARGLALFTEVAQGGAERDGGSDVYVPRGSSLPAARALFVLGIHNAVLTVPETSRLDHVAAARAARGSLFAQRESLIVRFRPGESSDTILAPLREFEAGDWLDAEALREAWSAHITWRPERGSAAADVA